MSIFDILIFFLKFFICFVGFYLEFIIIFKYIIVFDLVDYEFEFVIIFGKEVKNVFEVDVFDYVFGYIVCNDIFFCVLQFVQMQWCYFKGFDGVCFIGFVLVFKDVIKDVGKFRFRGLKNGKVVQDSLFIDFIFFVEQIVSFVL